MDDYLDATLTAYPPSFRGGDFSTMNTTQLYAKVYQNWPRDQIIYDPRFFVVHHFNAGANIRNQPIDQTTNEDAELLYENGKVDVKASDVDFVVPTYWDNTQIPAKGNRVYYDSTQQEVDSEDGQAVKQLRFKEHWRISSQRRGKLLPYSYKFTTIGVANPADNSLLFNTLGVLDISQDFGFVNGEFITMLNSRTVELAKQDILIVNRGQGYTSNSKFLTEGGSGGGVVLKAIVDESGGITGFTVESPGYDFAPEDFVNSLDEVSYSGDAPASLTRPDFSGIRVRIVPHPDSKAGSDFEGYICRGSMVNGPLITDAKPMEALTQTGPIKLTPNPPLQREGNTIQTPQETASVTTNLSVRLDPDATTANNQYDVFLHFHNDISHTRTENPDRPPTLDQMVRLSIGTGGDLTSNAQGQNQNDSAANGNFAGNGFAAGFGNFNFGGGLLGGGGFFGGANGNLGGGGFFR